MCWISKLSPDIHEVLEEKDAIKVKKVVLKLPGGDLVSVCRGYNYELDKLYQINELDIYLNKIFWECSRAFHSYIESIKICHDPQHNSYLILYNNILIDALYSIDYKYDLCILHCLIPKDSRYCINKHGEVVSDKILPLYTEPINLASDVLG